MLYLFLSIATLSLMNLYSQLNHYNDLTKKLNYVSYDAITDNVTAEVIIRDTQAIFGSRHKDGRQMQIIMDYSTMKVFVGVYDGSTWANHDLW